MADVARSSPGTVNKNRLRYQKVKVFLQRFPGKLGDDAERAVTASPSYKVYIDGKFSQGGNLEADGSVELLIPGGAKAVLKTLGTDYEIEPLQSLETHSALTGVQRRLQLLGYYDYSVDDKWGARTDAAVLDFQADYGLDPNGNALEVATVDKIKEIFGE